MKLRKQTPAKVAIVVASVGLLFAFYGVIKSEPRIKAAPEPESLPVDYQRFFVPAPSADFPTSPEPVSPHRRTRAS